jgi:hypothetical protein
VAWRDGSEPVGKVRARPLVSLLLVLDIAGRRMKHRRTTGINYVRGVVASKRRLVAYFGGIETWKNAALG